MTGLAEDVNGTIWLATAGSGAWRIPPMEDLPTTLPQRVWAPMTFAINYWERAR